MTLSTAACRRIARAAFAFGAVALLAACAGIQRVELHPNTQQVCDSSFGTPCGISDQQQVIVRVWGQGVCGSVGLDLGDGTRRFGPPNFDFGQTGSLRPLEIPHTYATAWPGPKTVHAFSASNCVGEARSNVNVLRQSGPSTYRINYVLALTQPPVGVFGQPVGPQACNFVPSVRPLRPNTRVTVTANPDPAVRIRFGCPGCEFGAAGEPGSSAPNGFPFPGFRKYSLVLRVGGDRVQGDSAVTFTTSTGGPVEVCVNDDYLDDNTGAWGLTFAVDETQAR